MCKGIFFNNERIILDHIRVNRAMLCYFWILFLYNRVGFLVVTLQLLIGIAWHLLCRSEEELYEIQGQLMNYLFISFLEQLPISLIKLS